MIWKAEPDPTNPGQWRIINFNTRKTVVYGLSQRDAEDFSRRRNFQEDKKHERSKTTT